MTNAQHIDQARSQLQAIELTDKNREFLEKALQVLQDKPIAGIHVATTRKGAMFTVRYEDGDQREYAAG